MNFSKTTRLFDTIVHLKKRQIAYRLKYIFFKKKRLSILKKHLLTNTSQKVSLHNIQFLPEKSSLDQLGSVCFLNQTQEFTHFPNWGQMNYGLLWNYKLNYFSFLLQENFNPEFGKVLILNHKQTVLSGSAPESLDPYPVSLRLINCLVFLSLHPNLVNEELTIWLNAQARLLADFPEYHVDGNHLLENAIALVFSGLLLEDSKVADQGFALLGKTLKEQYLEDGAHFELCPMYHILLTYRLLLLYQVVKRISMNGFEPILKKSLEKQLGWITAMQFDDGSLPEFNDYIEEEHPLPEKVLKLAADLNIYPYPVKLKDSGYRKFTNSLFEVFVDVGKIGPDFIPGHSHADQLSFVLKAGKKKVFLDTGTTTYADTPDRMFEKSTAAHNTVVLDQTSSAEVWGGFRVAKRGKVVITNETPFSISAYHTGYKHLGYRHSRTFKISADRFEIIDKIKGQPLSCEAKFIFETSPVLANNLSEELHFEILGFTLQFKNATSFSLKESWYGGGFSIKKPCSILIVNFSEELFTSFRKLAG
jgi:hypothetical protein